MQPCIGWAEVGHLTLPRGVGLARVIIGLGMARIMQRQIVIVGQRKARKSVTICYRPRGMHYGGRYLIQEVGLQKRKRRKRKRIGSRIAQLWA